MKTTTFLLLVLSGLFFFRVNSLTAQTESALYKIDSVRYALYQSRLTVYLDKAQQLCDSIRFAADNATARRYGKQLEKMTKELLASADAIYGFSEQTNTVNSTAVHNGNVVPVTLTFTTTSGVPAPGRSLLVKIGDNAWYASWIPFAREKSLKRAEKLLAELRTY